MNALGSQIITRFRHEPFWLPRFNDKASVCLGTMSDLLLQDGRCAKICERSAVSESKTPEQPTNHAGIVKRGAKISRFPLICK